MNGWISREDQMPDNFVYVLAATFGNVRKVLYNLDHEQFEDEQSRGVYGVTDWMPMPPLPERVDKCKGPRVVASPPGEGWTECSAGWPPVYTRLSLWDGTCIYLGFFDDQKVQFRSNWSGAQIGGITHWKPYEEPGDKAADVPIVESAEQPRCENCEHWRRWPGQKAGFCSIIAGATNYAPTRECPGTRLVDADFGCICFKKREGPFSIEGRGMGYAVVYRDLTCAPTMCNFDVAQMWREWLNELWVERCTDEPT